MDTSIVPRAYWILNGINSLVFLLRFLALAKVNPRFSLLSETMENMAWQLLNFAIVFLVFLFFFSIEAMMMFGDKIPGFSWFGVSLIEVIGMVVGGGGGSTSRRTGGGAALVDVVDYDHLRQVGRYSRGETEGGSRRSVRGEEERREGGEGEE